MTVMTITICYSFFFHRTVLCIYCDCNTETRCYGRNGRGETVFPFEGGSGGESAAELPQDARGRRVSKRFWRKNNIFVNGSVSRVKCFACTTPCCKYESRICNIFDGSQLRETRRDYNIAWTCDELVCQCVCTYVCTYERVFCVYIRVRVWLYLSTKR